jgi:glyoxylase-like metal-dependent hydrolase (beta-lactamase superfamily II)
MILRQLLHTEPAIAASYLVGCAGHGSAAIIDPVDPAETYTTLADSLGVEVKMVIDTHLHADHLSTAREIVAATGADYVLHRSAAAGFAFHAVDHGDQLRLGNVELTVLHLPGHTPEHIGLVVTDRTRGSRPWLVFTGHTLMIGDLGRTELASSAEEGARNLFRSARELLALPAHVVVLPGAFSGSVCGRGLSGNPISTIGFERAHNNALRLMDDEAAFVAFMQEETPPRPPRADEIRRANMEPAHSTITVA